MHKEKHFKLTSNTMCEVPDDLKNYICEFAANDMKLWRPFFSPTTGTFSWKVNRHCAKYIKLSRVFVFRHIKTNTRIQLSQPREENDRREQSFMGEVDIVSNGIDTVCITFCLDEDTYVARFVRTCKKTNGRLYKNGIDYGHIIDSGIKWNPDKTTVSYVWLSSLTMLWHL